MHRYSESQAKPALPAADMVDNLLSVVTAIVATTEFDEHDRERMLQSLSDAIEVARTAAATPITQRFQQTDHRPMTVAEADASADL
jgi:hypothetical protein